MTDRERKQAVAAIREQLAAPDEHVEAAMEGEVDVYDRYLRGKFYGYVVETPDDDHADACWGIDEDRAVEQATEIAEQAAANYASADHFLGAGI